jgi:20S proteasome alpha/beta subunit
MAEISKYVISELQSLHYEIQRLTLWLKVEYAVKAVENGGTAIGIRCKDGVVLALEKLVTSRLLKPGANKRIATVDRNIGVVCLLGS